MDLQTGEQRWKGKEPVSDKYIEIRGAKIVGMTHSKQGGKETFIATITISNREQAETDMSNLQKNDVIKIADKLGEREGFSGGEGGEGSILAPFEPLDSFINSWRLSF